MSESKKQDEEPKENKKSSLGVLFVALILLALVFGIGIMNNTKHANNKQDTETVKITDEETKKKATKQTKNSEVEAKSESAATFNLEEASTPRILGDANAPVKISEHSSFTCGACGAFHKGNFKEIKADYIDTGKAYIVFDDFPRNSIDIKVGAIARCVPEENYFDFIQLLFETQKDWLNDDLITHLKQNAKLTGANEDKIEACLNSTELHKNLAQNQEEAHKNHGVAATPTLVINDNTVISGLAPYEEIKNALDTELKKVSP